LPEVIKNISVLMPVYNCGEYVSYAIKSILQQTFRDFEFIIINDGSTDNTENVVKSFDDDRIIWKTENRGTSVATLD
jgi:glycosyltransferase involved in cell wall biosynthesis